MTPKTHPVTSAPAMAIADAELRLSELWRAQRQPKWIETFHRPGWRFANPRDCDMSYALHNSVPVRQILARG